jgi:hypothetical protein
MESDDTPAQQSMPAPPPGFKLDEESAAAPKQNEGDNSWWGAVKGLGDAGLAVGSSGLKAVTHAVNDILPGADSRAALEKEIQTDPVLNYHPQTEGGKTAMDALSTVFSPVSWAAKKAHEGIASLTNERTADVAGDIATMLGTKGGAEAAGAAKGAVSGAAGKVADTWRDLVAKGREADQAVPSVADAGSRQSMGAAQVNPSPFTLTGQETGRGSPSFPQVKLAKNSGDVHPDEQSTRAGIVREVLNDSKEDAGIRTGVLTGNEQTLRSEYQAAKNPNQTPANALMADQIGAEQRALPKFAQQRVDATGADPTLTNDYQRGETINSAFYGEGGLKDYLNQQKSKVYQAALEKNGNDQIPIDITEGMLKDPQFTAGAKLMKHESVVGGAQELLSLAKTVGFKDPITGVQYAPGSVAAYQAVTKALNKGWTPENKATIGKINEAINQDIAKSGGGDLYQLGNKIHRLDKGLLSDSAGISDVFGEVDPNGIQTGKDFDRIPKILNNMPLDQWRHIHDTLDTLSRGHLRDAPEGMDPVPPELMQAAASAKAEMHGALAREVYSQGASNAGGWNANSANKALNGRVGQKILDALPPDEIRKFQVLNAAGHIMPGAHPYEGAGAQTARMGSEPGFIEKYAPKAGILAGAKVPIPGAALVGEKIGTKVSGMTKGRREAKHAASVSQTLRDNLNRNAGGRVGRASGGKVDHEALLARLIQRWHAAKKMNDAGTETLLKAPDASIIRALDIAGRSATL